MENKNFWWWNTERKYTIDEVKELIEKIKVFNAGAIDQYLTDHVDKVFSEWADSKAD